MLLELEGCDGACEQVNLLVVVTGHWNALSLGFKNCSIAYVV